MASHGRKRGRVIGLSDELRAALELLPAIDRRGVRIVLGDKVVFEAGTANERSGIVTKVDGVVVTVKLTHIRGKGAVPAMTPAKIDCRSYETTVANELEVLR